ncbi:Hypothetical Protein FCC1311_030072 [Hondaea fermentalgiana]|uniref:Pre-rRNA-processing protein RIX1 N-terminal domain-containing protein n=1 Tax=Hondaea fermentalgiana TaxID=2315210 RepID=A0A2R5G8B5_9STRA|nr:Hypothetical Protein FCC1311_030072 [Hondaea fermentalgiana]|eukprot:GBG26785.1 Hypothetical Protein FCC1311_030072 [Hondaea fermentalgiana]
MARRAGATDAGALATWLEHAGAVAVEADAAQERVDLEGAEDLDKAGGKRRKRARDERDKASGSSENAKVRALLQELAALGQATVAALRAQRPLADPAERDAAWTGDEPKRKADERAAKAAAKLQRRWHVLVGETAVRATARTGDAASAPGSAALRKLVGILAAESLAQCSVQNVDDNFAVYMDALHRLVTRASAEEAADFAPALVELVRARGRQTSTTAALNTDSQAQVSQMVLALARGLRATAEAAAARASWGSPGPELGSALEAQLVAASDILRMAPSLCRSAASQFDHACKILVSGAVGAHVQKLAAQVMARLPVAYGSNTSIAWDAVTQACLRGMVDILRALYKVKARGVLAQPGGISIRAAKAREGSSDPDVPEGATMGGGGKVSDFFPGLQAVARESQDLKTGSFVLAQAVSPAAAFEGLCAVLGNALRVAQGGLFLEISLEPILEAIELGLACSACADHPCFARTAAASLACLRDLAAVAGIKLLRFRSTITTLMERLLALPPARCPVDLQVAILDTCRALAIALGAGIGRHVAEAVLRRTAELVSFASEGAARDHDEKMAQAVASQTKGRAIKKRRVAARQLSRAAQGPNAPMPELCAAKAALAASEVILAVHGADLPQVVRDLFDAALLDALQPVLTGSSLLLDESSACARDTDLRLALLRALRATVLAPVLRVGTSSAVPTALVIFAHCLRDADPRVAETALLARASALALVHPSAPVVGAPRRLTAYVDDQDDLEEVAYLPPVRVQEDNDDDVMEANEEEEEEEEEKQTDNASEVVEEVVETTVTVEKSVAVAESPEENAMDDDDDDDKEEEEEEEEDEKTEATPARLAAQPRQTRAQRAAAAARREQEAAEEEEENDDDGGASDSGSDLPSIVDDE